MRLSTLHIEHFRCFADVTIIIDDYTCFVGPNGAGKSTVLAALNVFFRETANAATDTVTLCREDFHASDTSRPIRIEATFEGLDATAQADFKDYYRGGKLIISAVAEWSEASQNAPVVQYGQRLGIVAFRPYFEQEKGGAKAGDLQKLYDALRVEFPDLPTAKTKPDKIDALHRYEEEHPQECVPIPSEDQFYGVSRGSNRLANHIQWVYVPAVKDASEEGQDARNTAVGRLLARRVHSQINLKQPIEDIKNAALGEYQKLIADNKTALDTLSQSLNQRFHTWAHDGANILLDWQESDKSVQIAPPIAQVRAAEQAFVGSLVRFGHGLQRSFIFALLQECAEHGDTGPRLLLGCEEPELYQHPPQARYLAGVMQQLSTKNAQVLISTHSPMFVSGRSFEHVRMVLKDADGVASIKQATFDQIATSMAAATGRAKPAKAGGIEAKIEQDMQGPMNEIFFATVRILVEGIEDIAYINSYLTLSGQWQEFRSLGCHLVQVQGKSHLIEAAAIARHFELPTVVVFDCDGDTPEDDPEKPTGKRQKQADDNRAVFSLMNAADAPVFPEDTVWRPAVIAWPTNIGSIIAKEIGAENLQRIEQQVKAKYDIDLPGMKKNPLFIGYVMAQAWSEGLKSASLEKLCKNLLQFASGTMVATADSSEMIEELLPV